MILNTFAASAIANTAVNVAAVKPEANNSNKTSESLISMLGIRLWNFISVPVVFVVNFLKSLRSGVSKDNLSYKMFTELKQYNLNERAKRCFRIMIYGFDKIQGDCDILDERLVLSPEGRSSFDKVYEEIKGLGLQESFASVFNEIENIHNDYDYGQLNSETALTCMFNGLNDSGVKAFVEVFKCLHKKECTGKFLKELSKLGSSEYYHCEDAAYVSQILNIMGENWQQNPSVYSLFADMFVTDDLQSELVKTIKCCKNKELFIGKFVSVLNCIATNEDLKTKLFKLLRYAKNLNIKYDKYCIVKENDKTAYIFELREAKEGEGYVSLHDKVQESTRVLSLLTEKVLNHDANLLDPEKVINESITECTNKMLELSKELDAWRNKLRDKDSIYKKYCVEQINLDFN